MRHKQRNSSRGITIDQGQSLVIGRNPVREALLHRGEDVEVLYLSRNANPEIQHELQALADSRDIQVVEVQREELEKAARSDSHQGVGLLLRAKAPQDFKTLLAQIKEKTQSLVVLLDEVEDPHNLGSILRAAECFKADAVVWSHNRGAQLSPVVIKSSAGGALFVPSATVANSADALIKLKEAGYWAVGAESHATAQSLKVFDAPQKIVLVLGSEGAGIRPVLQKLLDFSIYIPMYGKIDSLNVGQAAAVFMYALGRGE